MVELTPELIKDLSKTHNGFYSWDYVAALAAWIIGVGAENERLQARVQELEQDLSDQSQKRLENAQVSTDRIIALEGKIRELEQEGRWIPVSERLPEEGQPVLIDFGNNEITVGIWFWENEPEEWSNGTDYVGWQHWNYGLDKFEPSDEPPLHWQSLPKPPSEEE